MKHAASTFLIVIIMLAVALAPLVRSGHATSRDLGITLQLERKDTYMLDLQCPLSGPYAWDIPHENISSDESNRCIKAAISMVDSYYGGHLSQDRIAYHVYHEVLGYPSPQDDLGHGMGVVNLGVVDLLQWALSGETVFRINEKPDFDLLKYYIDNNMPIIRDHGASHLITVIDGYDTDGQTVNLIDPLLGTKSKVAYDSLDVFVMWIVTGENITAKSDEPTIWMDSDGDGVVDFDETNRFHTDPYKNDTYGLGIDDKTMIKYLYIEHSTFPTATFECTPQTKWVYEQIAFDASQSIGNITAYEWNFGDGNINASTMPIINHAYNHPGIYNVTLRVTDNNGLRNITTSSIAVMAPTSDKFEYLFYRQSPDRKGFSPVRGPETPDLLWTASLNDSAVTSPIVAEGMVLVGTSSGRLQALNLTNGEIIWTFAAGAPISSSPAFQNGTIFFGTEQPGKIYSVDAHTQLVNWLYELTQGVAISSSPVIVDGKVLVGCSDGNLLCLDQWEGQVLWATHAIGDNVTSPAVDNDLAFATTTRGAAAVDILTGALIWQFYTTWPVISCPAVADDLVFVAEQNNDYICALERNTGQLVWSFWTGGWLTPPAVDSSKQLVIVGSKDTWLYCLDEQTGNVKWSCVEGPNYLSAPTISANGLVYVGTPDGNLYCFNEDTGNEIWKYNVSAPIVTSPSIIYGHILVGSLEGKIYCFGPPFRVDVTTVNIAISNLTMSRSEVARGHELQINATVENDGDSIETFNVTAYANGTAVNSKQITLVNGSSTTTTFVWNTTGFAYGNYAISAYATSVPDETNTGDNTYFGGSIVVTIPGDLNGDFTVNILDAIALANSYETTPSNPQWNPNADINDDGVADILDAIILAKHFNEYT